MPEDPMIAALLLERDGLQRRGLANRVAQVDEQLALHGYAPPATEPAAVPDSAQQTKESAAEARAKDAAPQTGKQAKAPAPRGRSAAPKDTA
ncbi:hypothetical protein [Streptomyces sp. NPDC048386]|uniref:hypothetical protein n=1 Tax=Streptomyces sp. NPDC048386 TaxID=3365541 RepID=UPI003722F5E6